MMNENEFRKLKRVDLFELLISQSRENEDLRQRLAEAEQKLAEREIQLEKAGSIAEAALRLNGVFEAAQAAADQYLENIKRLNGDGSEVPEIGETEKKAESENTEEPEKTQAPETETGDTQKKKAEEQKAKRINETRRSRWMKRREKSGK